VASAARLRRRYDRQRRAVMRTAERLNVAIKREAAATSRIANLRDRLRRGHRI
jgi:hypothetical protein